ncbi:carbohydrate ABC transporter permease [Deinococcus misasensis]|uniref:carbohydrate ABC transporter permease n=1 Tax=Deinococcus misasensis TaxID=392413 RepID=UPI000A03B65C|nr:carbohydrate ABC transporter permease [Deinococcus misasensis]
MIEQPHPTLQDKPAPSRLPHLLTRLPVYGVLVLWTLFAVVAIGWIVLASLSTTREIFSNTLLASGLHFENYLNALTTLNMGRYFFNTVWYVGIALVLIALISAPAAYALSRFEFRGRRTINTAMLSAQAIPGVMLVIPMFTLFLKLDLVNTITGLVLIYVGTSIPFTVFFLSGFFSTLPRELEEAAMIDGCTEVQAFWKVMLPLSQPGLVTVTIFNFVNLWNEYFWALIFVNSPEKRTLSIGLEALLQSMRYTGDWAGLFASVMIVVVPTLILYIFLSEKIVAGITAGAVK